LGPGTLAGPAWGDNKAGGDAAFTAQNSPRRPAFRQLAWGCECRPRRW